MHEKSVGPRAWKEKEHRTGNAKIVSFSENNLHQNDVSCPKNATDVYFRFRGKSPECSRNPIDTRARQVLRYLLHDFGLAPSVMERNCPARNKTPLRVTIRSAYDVTVDYR